MSPYAKRHRAFTLIELLIVITIIGILAVALIPRLTGGPSRARDAQRKSDLQQIATALEFYANDNNGGYPQGVGCVGTLFVSGGTYPLTNYMTTIPDDPTDNTTAILGYGSCTTGYAYVPLNTNTAAPNTYAEGYLLVARAESTSEVSSSGGLYYTASATTTWTPTYNSATNATASYNLSGAGAPSACTSTTTCTSSVARFYMIGH